MALPNYLANIKSSGIYRFVWDKSEIPGVDTQTLRLVVGYSPKGVFNTPVYVENQDQFKTIFGDINKKLERYGIFFHRNALECLKHSPIFCLNLKPFTSPEENPSKSEKVNFYNFDNLSIFRNYDYTNDGNKTFIKNLFDTNRFWTLEPEKLDNLATDPVKYITIASTDEESTSKTIVMRGTRPSGYNVTFKDYFSQSLNGADLPDYLIDHENDIMSDYFAEIYVFAGEWTSEFKSTQAMSRYFNNSDPSLPMKANVDNAFGEPVDTLSVMADDPNSGFVNKYVGILLPDFQSPVSTALSLDDVFNADNSTHKMMMHLNANLLFDGPTPMDVSEVSTTGWLNCLNNSENLSLNNISVLSASQINPSFNGYTIDTDGTVKHDDFVDTPTALGPGESIDNTKDFTIFDLNHTTGSEIEKVLYEITGWDTASDTCKTTFSIKTDTFNKLVETQVITKDQGTWTPADVAASLVPVSILETAYKLKLNDRFLVYGKDDSTSSVTGRIASISDIESKVEPDTNGITITYTYTFDKGIVSIAGNIAKLIDYGNGTVLLVKCNKGLSDSEKSYTELYFKGYTYGTVEFLSTNKDGKINKILNVLKDEKGIYTGLTDNTSIEYHYLVDTFTTFLDGNGLTATKNIKNKMAMIARQKDNCLALLNWPSVENLMKNIGEGKTSTETIAMITSAEYYKCDSDYQSWVEYVTPLKYRNLYTGNKFEVPGAADLSNNYIEKFSSRYPYSIVAGPNYGVIDNAALVGPDFLYSREELDLYEPYGVNCFVYKPRKGTFINSQQTAKQKPVTTLSKVNVRELVIYIQDEIEKLLTDYQWEFNTQSLRETVKAKADVICEQIKNNGGIYEYFNVCDESNNDNDVINNEMFVLSTSIEPGMGAGKMVQELTIYRKGGMSSVIR